MAQGTPFDDLMRSRGLRPSDSAAVEPKTAVLEGQAQQETAKGAIAPRKERSDVEHTEASTGKDIVQTKVGERELALPNLPPGAEAADKKFADQYVAWRSSDIGSYNKNLDQLQSAINLLRANKDNISGPWFGLLPEFIRKRVSPTSKNVHDDIYNAIQASLRQTLGAQFTQAEGERLMGASFDKDLPESDNLTRAERLIEELRSRGANMESMARYWEAPGPNGLPRGTLQGYVPADIEEIRKLLPPKEPRDDEPWLSPEQEEALIAYVNGEGVTADGFVSLLKKFADENSLALDTEDAMARGKEIEARRQKGLDYAPRVQYQRALPSPDALVAPEDEAGGLSWGEAGLEALKNFPASGGRFLGDTVGGVRDIMSRPTHTPPVGGVPGQLIDQMYEIGKSALGAIGIIDADPALAQAIGNFYAERYGGVEEFKQTLAHDPVGTLADLSTVVTGLGGAGVKGAQIAGTSGKLARGVRITGRAMDPINLTAGGVEGLAGLSARYLPQRLKTAGGTALEHLTQKYPAMFAAFPSGIGGETIEEAVGAGRQRSLKGPNPRSQAFTEQMRGNAPAANIVEELEKGVSQLREIASQRYQRDMLPISQDSTQLDFNPVLQAVARLKPRTARTYGGKQSGAEQAWEQADALAREHADLIAQDPARYATPAALDDFKKRLRDVSKQFMEGKDRSAERIADRLYGAVTETIVRQAPDYSRVMKDYATAQKHLDQITGSLTVGGKTTNIDSSIRRLQTILRRNDPGHAGQLIEDVNAMPASELRAAVAGREAASVVPDRLRASIGAGGALAGGMLAPLFESTRGMALAPEHVALLGMMSPRLMGEASYGLGRGVGLGEKAARGAWDVYEAAPATTLAGLDAAATGYRISEEERRKRELLKRYGATIGADADLLSGYAAGQ